MINLTQQEREKFILYLRQEAASDKGMLEQFEKLGSPQPIKDALAKKFKTEAAAKLFVADLISRIEEMTIGN